MYTETLLRTELNLAGILILVLILIHSLQRRPATRARFCLHRVIFLDIFTLAVALLGSLSGSLASSAKSGWMILLAADILIALGLLCIGYLWLIYAETERRSALSGNGRIPQIAVAPAAAFALLILTTQQTRLLFYVDAAGVFHQGLLFPLCLLCPHAYFLTAALRACSGADSVLEEKCAKKGRRVLTVFPAFPILCSLFDLWTGGFSFTCVGVALGVLFLSLNLRHSDPMMQIVSVGNVTSDPSFSPEEAAKNEQTLRENSNIISSLSEIYFCTYYIDVKKDTFVELKSLDFLRSFLPLAGSASGGFRLWIQNSVYEEFQDDMLKFLRLDNLSERMRGKSIIAIDYQTRKMGWCRGNFIAVDRDEKGDLIHVLWASREINEEKEQQEQTKKYLYLYKHDALTGILNRYGFNEYLDEAFSDPKENALGLMILDIDHFKCINDTYGHDNGDLVLKDVASLLWETKGRGCVSRWGGEEFTVLLKGDFHAQEEAEELRRRIEALDIPIHSHLENSIRVTVSIGVCFTKRKDKITISQLVRTADKCLYTAKDAGRNRVVCEEI